MAKAVLCPVCNGEGEFKTRPCHGCDGKGWVQVREDICYHYYPNHLYTIPYGTDDSWHWRFYNAS